MSDFSINDQAPIPYTGHGPQFVVNLDATTEEYREAEREAHRRMAEEGPWTSIPVGVPRVDFVRGFIAGVLWNQDKKVDVVDADAKET